MWKLLFKFGLLCCVKYNKISYFSVTFDCSFTAANSWHIFVYYTLFTTKVKFLLDKCRMKFNLE
jgi:hypothetical protein